jgi:archaellum component FlaG (FlaF/FlaG flagellin family)
MACVEINEEEIMKIMKIAKAGGESVSSAAESISEIINGGENNGENKSAIEIIERKSESWRNLQPGE